LAAKEILEDLTLIFKFVSSAANYIKCCTLRIP